MRTGGQSVITGLDVTSVSEVKVTSNSSPEASQSSGKQGKCEMGCVSFMN